MFDYSNSIEFHIRQRFLTYKLLKMLEVSLLLGDTASLVLMNLKLFIGLLSNNKVFLTAVCLEAW
jgi:hypothetical protein